WPPQLNELLVNAPESHRRRRRKPETTIGYNSRVMPTPSTARLVLYGNAMWSSPYVLSCFVGLTEKKLPFEVQTVALHEGAQRSAAYVQTSFTARVPALVDGDFTLSESSAIIEYLEERWPPPAHPALLPADVQQRARARQIMAWVR